MAVLIALFACTHAGPKPAPPQMSIAAEVSFGGGETPENAIWMMYPIGRSVYISQHPNQYEQVPGRIVPAFAEEVEIRGKLVKIYQEMRAKDGKLDLPYFNDLSQVAASPFMREYVWTYLHQDTWGPAPADLKLPAFDDWRKANLPNHRAVTRGGVRFEAKPGTRVPAKEPRKEYSMLMEGRRLAEKEDHQHALRYADQVIEYYESSYKGALQRVYSAENSAQAEVYAALPGPQPVEVIDGLWAAAWFMKGWSLEGLKRFPEARTALETAIALSPSNSQYLSELAYTYQVDHAYDKALPLFVKATQAAEQARDPATNTVNLTRAWRGQAYCLVEQGKWDEAETLYGKAIALDPRDQKSKNELEYIQRNKKR
jgi:tetratricopeptide (TPR) repeat protein